MATHVSENGLTVPSPGANRAPLFQIEVKKADNLHNPLANGGRSVNIMITRPDSICIDFVPFINIKVKEALNLYRAARANFIKNLTDEAYLILLDAARNVYDKSRGKVIVSIPSWDCSTTIPITR